VSSGTGMLPSKPYSGIDVDLFPANEAVEKTVSGAANEGARRSE
jgi:hypothetical protein